MFYVSFGDIFTSKKFSTFIKQPENWLLLPVVFEKLTYMMFMFLATPRYVRWFLEDTLIADTRDETVSAKYAIWQNGSLQVNDVQASDSGDYVCEGKFFKVNASCNILDFD